MSGLIPPGKNAAERTAYLKKITGGLPDGQSSLFGENSEEVRENQKMKKEEWLMECHDCGHQFIQPITPTSGNVTDCPACKHTASAWAISLIVREA